MRLFADNHLTYDCVCDFHLTIDFGGSGCVCRKVHQDVVAFVLIVDGICIFAGISLVNAVNGAAEFYDEVREPVDESSLVFFRNVIVDDVKDFILVHLFIPPCGLCGLLKQARKLVDNISTCNYYK